MAGRVSSRRCHEAAAGNPISFCERPLCGNMPYAYSRPRSVARATQCRQGTLQSTHSAVH